MGFGKIGCEEWLVRLTQSMYENAKSRVRVGCNLSEELGGIHQGSYLSPMLCITVPGLTWKEMGLGST